MQSKILTSLLLSSTLILSACNSESDDSGTTDSTKSEAAHAFATDLQNAMLPVLEAEDVLTDFSVKLEEDISEVNTESLVTMGEITSALLKNLNSYLRDALVVDSSGYITDVDLDLLSTTHNVEEFDGLTIRRDGTALTIEGTGLETNADITVNLTASITLPAIDVTEDSISFPFANFTFTDTTGASFTITSGNINFRYSESIDSYEPDDLYLTAFGLSLENLIVSIGDVQLSGTGEYQVEDNPFFELNEDILFQDFELAIDGSLTNSHGISLATDTTITLETIPDYSDPYRNMISQLDLDLSFIFDLTNETTSNTLLTAGMVFDLFSDENISYEDYQNLNFPNNIDLTFNGSLNLTVGEAQIGLGLIVESEEGDSKGSYLVDSTNNTQEVRMVQLGESEFETAENLITFARITVDNEIQANVIIDYSEYRVFADFENLNDVTIISGADLIWILDYLGIDLP